MDTGYGTAGTPGWDENMHPLYFFPAKFFRDDALPGSLRHPHDRTTPCINCAETAQIPPKPPKPYKI